MVITQFQYLFKIIVKKVYFKKKTENWKDYIVFRKWSFPVTCNIWALRGHLKEFWGLFDYYTFFVNLCIIKIAVNMQYKKDSRYFKK